MTQAPTPGRRRSRAAAGAHPPRRPRAGRPAVAALAAGAPVTVLLTAVAVFLGACGGGGGGAPAASGNVFGAAQQVSLRQVQRSIDTLYRGHPGISSFAAADVQYTAQSRGDVLAECTSPAAGASSQSAGSSQVIACAPLIYFLYSYGRQARVPASVTAAGQLYWYAVTHIAGQVSARTSLDELLHSWKLPVPGLTPAQARQALEGSVVTAAGDSMLTRKSVHIVITGRKAGSAAVAEQIVADIGTATGAESIKSGAATATIRVTRKAAYFTGSPAGLTTFIGLSRAAARKARSRWVAIKAGASEYRDLAAEDTMAALPASILPASGRSARLRTATISGQKVYVLDWTTTASGSSATISEQLTLAATSQALPISETTTTNGDRQTVTLGNWGKQFAVPVPTAAVPYSNVKS